MLKDNQSNSKNDQRVGSSVISDDETPTNKKEERQEKKSKEGGIHGRRICGERGCEFEGIGSKKELR